MNYAVENVTPYFPGINGLPLQGGKVYFGAPSNNPVTNPVAVFWDSAGTQPAQQPVLISNGRTVRSDGTPARIYAPVDHSVLVQDATGAQVFYVPTSQGSLLSSIRQTTSVDTFSGTGASATYTLSSTPASKNDTEVFVNGVYQQKSAYTLTGNQLTIAASAGVNNVEVESAVLLDYATISAAITASQSAAAGSAAAAGVSAANAAASQVAAAASQVAAGTSATNAASSEAQAAAIVLGTFLQNGTGAVARTFTSKAREVFSVADFAANGVSGAAVDPTGVVDSTLGIQAAIAVAGALGGAIVYFPPGTYKTTATINMAANVGLRGAGKYSSVISYNGTADAVKMSNRVNSSSAAKNTVRDLSITMTNAAATGACYDDVGGSFIEIYNCALTGGKFGVVLDQSELVTIRQCDIEAQVAGGAGVWLVNGADHTPAVTFTAAPVLGATSGTLTGNWAGLTGTYNLEFTETVGGAREQRVATLTNGSTAVTWAVGLSAACNAATTGAASQFTNRILICENQFNNGSILASHIVDDGGVSHVIRDNNFNSGVVAATPALCRFCGVTGLLFSGNEMEGGQNFLSFASTSFYAGVGAGGCAAVDILSNVFSQSQANAPITLTAFANPMSLVGNWFGGNSAYKVTGAANITSMCAPGNVVTTGALLDANPTYLTQFDNLGNRVNGLTSFDGGIGYGTGAGGTVTQTAGSKANGVTLNKITGEIVLCNANIAANTALNIPFTNSKIGANDVVVVQRKSGGTDSAYRVWCDRTFAGGCQIGFKNDTAGALAEAVTLQFAVIPSVVA